MHATAPACGPRIQPGLKRAPRRPGAGRCTVSWKRQRLCKSLSAPGAEMREGRACGRRSCLLASRALKTHSLHQREADEQKLSFFWIASWKRGCGRAGRGTEEDAPPSRPRSAVPGSAPGAAGSPAGWSPAVARATRVVVVPRAAVSATPGVWGGAAPPAGRGLWPPAQRGAPAETLGEPGSGSGSGGRRLSPGRREPPPRCGPERTRPRGRPTRVCRPRPCRAEAPSRPGSPGPA